MSLGRRWVPFASRPAGSRVALLLVLLLAGCARQGMLPGGRAFPPQEQFDSGTTYSRLFQASPGRTCEAARRALLSQGYIIQSYGADLVEGRKNFQPEVDTHLQMTIRVVCVPEAGQGASSSLGFVTALQDTYALKKSANSASVGVGAIGSLSLPITSESDSLVRVGSVTITTAAFYESFFELVRKYLVQDDIAGGQPSAM